MGQRTASRRADQSRVAAGAQIRGDLRPRWHGEGRGGSAGSPRTSPQPGSEPLHKARTLPLGQAPDVGQTKAQVPQCLSMQVGEMGRQLRAPSDGSPAAKYRLSTPVLASTALSTSVAKFRCSRRRSKRWRRPSMATAGPGLAARARSRRCAPVPPGTRRLLLKRVAPFCSLAGLCLQFGPRPLPDAPANGRAGRAGRAKELGPAPSPPPHCPLAAVAAAGATHSKEGGGAQRPRSPIGRGGAGRS